MEVGFDLGSPPSPHTGPLGGDGHSGWGGAPQGGLGYLEASSHRAGQHPGVSSACRS